MPKLVVLLLAAVAAVASVPPLASPALAQEQAPIHPSGAGRNPNALVEYSILRSSVASQPGITVRNLVIEREGAKFTFSDGNFYLYPAINGRVTGGVFLGKGHFSLKVSDPREQHSLAYFSKSEGLEQDFTSLLLRFTDETAAEITRASAGTTGPSTEAQQIAGESAKKFRQHLHENFEQRLLEDIVPDRGGSFFLASFRMGGAFTGHNVLFTIDPDDSPDQVSFATWDDYTYDVWAGYRMSDRSKVAVPLRIVEEQPDVTIERSGNLIGSTETTFTVFRDQTRVLPLNLYPTLRVSAVFDETGTPLDFIQEGKEFDPQFAVVLAQPAKAGQKVRILTKYAGKDAVRRDGDAMYYLADGARESWYPSGHNSFGDFTNFRMTFHIPKRLQIVATGKEVSRDSDANGTRVVWATDKPIPVAGFNLGEFKTASRKTPTGFDVTSYANTALPDSVAGLANQGALGSLDTTMLLKDQVEQGWAAIQVYTDYFGPLPFDHVALTEQSSCSFGQSWPMLVYLPMCAFWDSTARHGLGLDAHDASYWDEVTPHEVAHQWWGSLIGFDSYRDQWMSEGFANFSTGVYLKQTEKTMDKYRTFWKEQRRNLLEKNTNGKRPVDVGPLTMGYRVNNEKTGDWVAQELIYSKGAYVLHMLEMLYWTPKYGETPFRESMKRFTHDYAGRAATTEDFKASMEKGMPSWMDLDHNGRMDWFFNEWVYGTEVPRYVITGDFTVADGVTSMHMKLTQSGVSSSFRMIVPIYLQMENGTVTRIGAAVLNGNDTYERTVSLGKMPSPAKKLLLNYNGDILSE
ncbi:M1 family aminopeptidase [Bryocella elongata]|nr:M1 family aminopeptidase [Bryocella elongata]